MDYLEIKFTIPSDFRDIVIAELSEKGFDTFLETEEGFNTYVDRPDLDPSPIEEVIAQYKDRCPITYETTTFPDKNWNEEWEKNFDPIVVEDQCLIRAPFHQIDKSYALEILIEPKMAFGTGHHATTYLMIKQMLKLKWQGKKVLDLGCGTGILSIAAMKLGASEVWATDINEWSIDNSQNNFNLNNCSEIQLLCGQIEELQIPENFDYVLANINRNVLIEEIPAYRKKMAAEGLLMLSGFFEEDKHHIEQSVEASGMKVVDHSILREWSVLVCQADFTNN